MRWLKKAFAVDPPGPAVPTEEEKLVVDLVIREIIRRELATPALMFLESWRPLNYLSAQALHFFVPVVSVLGDAEKYTHFARFLEKRGSVDYLCDRIVQLDDDRNTQESPAPLEPTPTDEAEKLS